VIGHGAVESITKKTASIVRILYSKEMQREALFAEGIHGALFGLKRDTEYGIIDTLAKLRKTTVTFIMSVRLHGTTRLPLDGFS
jgi:hypothetical protein